MNPETGEIFKSDLSDEELLKKGFIELSEAEYNGLKPLSNKKRKNKMRNKLCECGSGKKFKRCCWSSYKAKTIQNKEDK